MKILLQKLAREAEIFEQTMAGVASAGVLTILVNGVAMGDERAISAGGIPAAIGGAGLIGAAYFKRMLQNYYNSINL